MSSHKISKHQRGKGKILNSTCIPRKQFDYFAFNFSLSKCFRFYVLYFYWKSKQIMCWSRQWFEWRDTFVCLFPRNQSLTVKVQGHWTAKTSSCSLFSGRMMHIAHKTGKHFPKIAAFIFFPHNSHWLLHYFSFTTKIAFKKSWAKCSQIGPDFIQTDQTPALRDLRPPSTGQYQSHRFPQLMTFPQQQ